MLSVNGISGTVTAGLTKTGTAAQKLFPGRQHLPGTTNIMRRNDLPVFGAAGAFSPNSQVLLANVSGATLNVASLG